jgi:hypothetical protein
MLKTFLKKLAIIAIELAVIFGGLYYLAQRKGIHTLSQVMPALENTIQDVQKQVAPFPQLSDPIVKTFNWEYKGTKYSLNETLYQSVYEYYKAQPKEYSYAETLPANWKDQYYGMFLKSDPADKTIADLAQQIQSLGKKHNLSGDQIVDLTLAFVQSIQYDDAKAKDILAKQGNVTMRYPYEVLWQQLGVCSDKSLLAYSLLRQMGYGAALFTFEQENHMAVAVQCPQSYSSYDSGYCYAETTSTGNKIGIIPDFDTQSNKTVDAKQLTNYNPEQSQQMNLQKLGQVTIILPTDGLQYSEIIQTEKIASQIDQLKKNIETLLPQLTAQKNAINQEKDELASIEKDMENYKKDKNFDKYNNYVERYNSLLGDYKKDVEKYNSSVMLYNGYVRKYNELIKQ